MEPVWLSYDKWECFQNDMYGSRKDKTVILNCFELLVGDELLTEMARVTKEWPNSTLVRFTNKKFNPVSWLGQAACCLNYGAKATETVSAWMSMSKEQQDKANDIAKQIIEEWRNGQDL